MSVLLALKRIASGEENTMLDALRSIGKRPGIFARHLERSRPSIIVRLKTNKPCANPTEPPLSEASFPPYSLPSRTYASGEVEHPPRPAGQASPRRASRNHQSPATFEPMGVMLRSNRYQAEIRRPWPTS
ncbi:MAG: hypothetical protein IPJ50_23035 [Betaproteobacteria bacterium]|nr:hypothetical protein [Betaproteobacteria bacterium]